MNTVDLLLEALETTELSVNVLDGHSDLIFFFLYVSQFCLQTEESSAGQFIRLVWVGRARNASRRDPGEGGDHKGGPFRLEAAFH